MYFVSYPSNGKRICPDRCFFNRHVYFFFRYAIDSYVLFGDIIGKSRACEGDGFAFLYFRYIVGVYSYTGEIDGCVLGVFVCKYGYVYRGGCLIHEQLLGTVFSILVGIYIICSQHAGCRPFMSVYGIKGTTESYHFIDVRIRQEFQCSFSR